MRAIEGCAGAGGDWGAGEEGCCPPQGGHQQRRELRRCSKLFLHPLQLSGPDYRLAEGEELVSVY